MAWMKEAAPRLYLKRRWMKKKVGCAITPRHQIQILCSACVGVGVQSQEQKGSHQPTPALIITAAEPALGSEQTNEMQKPTHCDSVHNKRCIANTVTYKPFTHKHTSISGYTDIKIGTWFHISQQACTGDHSPQTNPPPSQPERKEAVRHLFPDRRSAQFSPKLVFHSPRQRNTWPGRAPRATPKP